MKNIRTFGAIGSLVTLTVTAALLYVPKTYASTVYTCQSDGSKCVIRLDEGIVGDRVNVLDDKANIIGSGHITKRRGSYGIISLSSVSKTIRKGYPVIVSSESKTSNLQWAASFSDKDF